MDNSTDLAEAVGRWIGDQSSLGKGWEFGNTFVFGWLGRLWTGLDDDDSRFHPTFGSFCWLDDDFFE